MEDDVVEDATSVLLGENASALAQNSGDEGIALDDDDGPSRQPSAIQEPPRKRGLGAAMLNAARKRWTRAKSAVFAAGRTRRLAELDKRDFLLRCGPLAALLPAQPLRSLHYCSLAGGVP
jgi:hypothetical protein